MLFKLSTADLDAKIIIKKLCVVLFTRDVTRLKKMKKIVILFNLLYLCDEMFIAG